MFSKNLADSNLTNGHKNISSCNAFDWIRWEHSQLFNFIVVYAKKKVEVHNEANGSGK